MYWITIKVLDGHAMQSRGSGGYPDKSSAYKQVVLHYLKPLTNDKIL